PSRRHGAAPDPVPKDFILLIRCEVEACGARYPLDGGHAPDHWRARVGARMAGTAAWAGLVVRLYWRCGCGCGCWCAVRVRRSRDSGPAGGYGRGGGGGGGVVVVVVLVLVLLLMLVLVLLWGCLRVPNIVPVRGRSLLRCPCGRLAAGVVVGAAAAAAAVVRVAVAARSALSLIILPILSTGHVRAYVRRRRHAQHILTA
ncbi:hypothetical protein BDZ91DRAFT_769102, partial [Kalaharituber pfeilii]